MSYGVVLSDETKKILSRLDRTAEQRISARFKQLAEDAFDPRLSAVLTERAGVGKSRVGGWRILFLVDRDISTIFILTVDTSGQVYKHSRADLFVRCRSETATPSPAHPGISGSTI